MRRVDLDRQHHGRVAVDLCNACQALWFDALESLHLSLVGTPDRNAAGILEAARFEREMKLEQARSGQGSMVDLVSVGIGALAAALFARG